MDQAELLAKMRARDARAFAWLLDTYHTQFVRVASAFVPSLAIAEEVSQDTWVAIVEGIDGFEGRSSLKTWMFRILTNKAKSRGVREARTEPFAELGPAEPGDEVAAERFGQNGMWQSPPAGWAVRTPQELLASAQGVAILQRAIAELPTTQQAVITLHEINELSPAEVCNVLELSETNFRVLLHRARTRLRSIVEIELGK